jgi:hypothetical protein
MRSAKSSTLFTPKALYLGALGRSAGLEESSKPHIDIGRESAGGEGGGRFFGDGFLSPWWVKTVTHRSKGDLLRKWIPMPLIA